MGIHEGHRQRLRDRFIKDGLDNFEEKHVLELILFYCIPRKDTAEIAYNLLKHFGSLAQVLDARPEELREVPGVGDGVATFLPLLNAVGRYYRVHRTKPVSVLTTVEACGDYIVPYFHGRKNETVFLLCLDAKCKVLACKEVGEGIVNSASISTRRIVEMALGAGASSVVLAHNHPSGIALPSPDDILTTRQVALGLAAVDIVLTDHLVVADDDYVSMAQSGFYNYEEVCSALNG